MPAIDITLASLVRSYFNLYSKTLRNKFRKHGSRRFEIRKSRRLIKRIHIGRPELKHGADNIIITLYIYNLEKKYLNNKILKIPAIYKHNSTTLNKITKAKNLYLNKTNVTGTLIKNKLSEQKKFFSLLKKNKVVFDRSTNIDSYKKQFTKIYIRKFLRRESISIFYKQMLAFNRSKFEKRYVYFLAKNIMSIYNKKVEFNFVNLKHIYLDSEISSKALITKLKKLAKLKKYFLTGIDNFLHMFKVPRVSSLSVYDEIFNRKFITQNINNNTLYNINLPSNENAAAAKQDVMDNILKLSRFTEASTAISDVNKYKTLNTIYRITALIGAFKSTKYKIINGVRLLIAGRFTKRTSAARSVFKIRNKGSVRNKDSSIKGLPAVILKGYAHSNLQYNKVYSKVRGGSFGIKNSLSGG